MAYKVHDEYALHFVTFTIVDWVDIFTRRVYKDIIMDSLGFCVNHRMLVVYGYVIMSNHVHLLIRSGNGKLSETIHNFKKYTGRKIIDTVRDEPESRREWLIHRFKWNAGNHQTNSYHQIWKRNNHAIEITSKEFYYQKLHYIHDNPVRAGIVSFAEDYIYSSAYEISGRGNKVLISDWYD